MTSIDKAALARIAPRGSGAIRDGFADAVNQYGPRFGLGANPAELAHFVAQNAHESDGFRTVAEYASGHAYEGRKDLGNVQAGDGPRFKGRGTIQCTGRHNYRAFTRWAGKHFAPAPDFEAKPQALETAPWCFIVALWYWSERGIGRLIRGDEEDVVRVTRAINGGLNGLADRKLYLTRALAEIGPEPGAGTTARPPALLKFGSRGREVEALQARLAGLGLGPGLDPGPADGIFGRRTQSAVRVFQRGAGLVADGIVGPATWHALHAIASPLELAAAPLADEGPAAPSEPPHRPDDPGPDGPDGAAHADEADRRALVGLVVAAIALPAAASAVAVWAVAP